MRLKQHINEVTARDQLGDDDLNDLKKGCMPFLKDVKKVQKHYWHFLYRGFNRDQGDFSYTKPRTDRRPTDSSEDWQMALDFTFKKKYGVKVRSEGVFCKIVTPTGYGMDSMIFPIGKYSCIYSTKVSDAYYWEPRRQETDYGPDSWKEYIPDAEDMMTSYRQGGINAVVPSLPATIQKHEVALMCKAYYAVDIKFRDQLDDWIKNEI